MSTRPTTGCWKCFVPVGATGPAVIGAVGAALGLVPLLALARATGRAARREPTAAVQHRASDASELEPAPPPAARYGSPQLPPPAIHLSSR
jgi:hypothetical protein